MEISCVYPAAAKFVKENNQFGAVLISIMNTKYISKIMDILENNIIEEVMATSYSLSEDEITSLLPDFKEKIKEYVSSSEDNKMASKLIDLILLAKPSKELSLYKTLFSNEKYESAKEAAIQNFPSHLLLKLSGETLSFALASYSMKNKTELVFSLRENVEDQKTISDAFAAEGSTIKDMLDLEIEKYSDDLTLRKYVDDNTQNIWNDFVSHCRKILRANPDLQEEITGNIQTWIDSNKEPTQVEDSLDDNSDSTPEAA